MARATITLTDGEEELDVRIEFDPKVEDGETDSLAQQAAVMCADFLVRQLGAK